MGVKDSTGYWSDGRRAAFGERLKVARNAKSLSLDQVTAALGSTSRARIGHWETGERVPDVGALAQLCELLDISADKLVFGTEPWPFPRIDFDAVKKLDRADKYRLEGALLFAAGQLALEIERSDQLPIESSDATTIAEFVAEKHAGVIARSVARGELGSKTAAAPSAAPPASAKRKRAPAKQK